MRSPEEIIGHDALTQLIYEGYAVVPWEPTQAMKEAGFHAHLEEIKSFIEPKAGSSDFARGLAIGRGMISSKETDAAYRAMIAEGHKRPVALEKAPT